MKWQLVIVLVGSLLSNLRATAQVTVNSDRTATMSDREANSLRGPVKSCTVEYSYPGGTNAEGKIFPEQHLEHTTEYDLSGHVLSERSGNSDGSYWVARQDYDASGRLLKIRSGTEGQALTETTYSYDELGRLQNIRDGSKPESPITFWYDERGRKIKTQTSRPEDYRPNVASGLGPFDGADQAPNLPGGGATITTYDEHDRPTQVEVRDAEGNAVYKALRTYDAHGNVMEEKLILADPAAMFPAEALAKVVQETGLPLEQLRKEMRTEFAKFMGSDSTINSMSNTYDAQGRLSRSRRRIFNHEQETETTYNDQGDVVSEITRSTRTSEAGNTQGGDDGFPAYSEVTFSYQYDEHKNWIEKSTAYRSGPNEAFGPSTATKRKLSYY